MDTISKYCVIAAICAATVSIGLMIFILIQRAIYKDQLEGVNTKRETLSDEMFDWKMDEFERSFTVKFTVPTIMVVVLCILVVSFSIMSVVFKIQL
ncbi:MAG: hypothetical protein PHV07_06720 [Oscillospiraceae bacterium]|nr:hypothetical protein [Oscillospiraceae bacterium]